MISEISLVQVTCKFSYGLGSLEILSAQEQLKNIKYYR